MSYSSGVGALPGHNTESGVARLPDEHTNTNNARQAGDSHAPGGDSSSHNLAAAATGASVGIAGVGAGASAMRSGSVGKDVGLPGGMDDRGRTSGVGAGGDLGTHSTQTQAHEARSTTLSPESEYSQPSFQASPPHTDTNTNKSTGLGGVGTSGATTGAMLAGGGFGGREPPQTDQQQQQPLSAPPPSSQTTQPPSQQTVGDAQKSAMEQRGTHTSTSPSTEAEKTTTPFVPGAATKAKGEEGEKVGRDAAAGGTEKETQMTSGGAAAGAATDAGEGKKTTEDKGGHKGAENKVCDFTLLYSFPHLLFSFLVCASRLFLFISLLASVPACIIARRPSFGVSVRPQCPRHSLISLLAGIRLVLGHDGRRSQPSFSPPSSVVNLHSYVHLLHVRISSRPFAF